MGLPLLALGAGLARKLGGKAVKAVLNKVKGGQMKLPAVIGRGTFPGTAISIGRKAGAIAAGGAAFELGGRAIGAGFGAPRKRYRRMNVGNAKALRRSMRRVEGFAKLARSCISFTKQVKMKGGKKCR